MESTKKYSSRKEESVKHAKGVNADLVLFHRNVELVEEEELLTIDKVQ